MANPLLLAGLAFTLGFGMLAIDSWAESTPDYKKWAACRHDNECAVVTGDCGVERAVNKRFLTQFRLNPSWGAVLACTKPLEFHPADTVARCERATCVLSPRGAYAGGTPMEWSDCDTASDCAWISLDCLGNGAAVNARYKDKAYALWCGPRSYCRTSCSASLPPNSLAACKNERCITEPIDKKAAPQYP